jgi:excisionase family DNA binding protein
VSTARVASESADSFTDYFLRLPPNDGLLSVREVARLLGVHVNTVKRFGPDELPFVRVGLRGDRRYRRADIERAVKRWTNAPMLKAP